MWTFPKVLRTCANSILKTKGNVCPTPRAAEMAVSKRCITSSVVHCQLSTNRERQQTGVIVSDAVNRLDPLEHYDYFNVRNLVEVGNMFNAFCHYGHHQDCRNEFMAPYLFGTRYSTDIFDLDKTVPLFQDALNFLAHIVYRGGIVLFISRQKLTMPLIESMAKRCGEYAHCRYWNPELFTNTRHAVGFPTRLPDICVLLGSQNSAFQAHKAVIDSAKLLIPTIGIVDSNCDPRLITYPIPANDDTFSSVQYYLEVFEETVKRAKQKRKEDFSTDVQE
ncbi:28S ribosomal protein S2, mitochondrial-like [Mya arenaria]|uniref:28S ribosomal protein S2, mitochondrial-like n=1 Tax=Mya arenaria TaxID=6604 RepID=UPI0022E59899|nr:28S ribosomal protein S2, mitochondrial-like [Mya arenaria]